MSGWSIHADAYDPDENYAGEISGYDPDEDAREQREDTFAGMGFFPDNPADNEPTLAERRRAYLIRTGYAS